MPELSFWPLVVVGPVDDEVDEGEGDTDEDGVPLDMTLKTVFRTKVQRRVCVFQKEVTRDGEKRHWASTTVPPKSTASRQLTLVGVASSALVGLDTIVTLVETLVAASDGNAVVVGEVPSLLVETWVRGPDFEGPVVAWGGTGIES